MILLANEQNAIKTKLILIKTQLANQLTNFVGSVKVLLDPAS